MSKSVIPAALAAVVLGAAGSAGAAADASACKLEKIGEMKVTLLGTRPLVAVTINGKPVRFIRDTGAFFTSISAGAATELGLAGGAFDGLRVVGIGGETKVRVTQVQDFALEGITFHKVDLLILGESSGSGESGGAAPAGGPVVGLMGQNFFRDMDVEYDLPHGAVRLFTPKGCGKAVLAYWAQSYSLATLKSPAPSS